MDDRMMRKPQDVDRWSDEVDRDAPADPITGPGDRWVNDSWSLLRADIDYTKFSGPDDVPFEGVGYEQGRTFPHPFAKAKAKSNKEYYSAVTNSPPGVTKAAGCARRNSSACSSEAAI